jgi:hypothetical protein
MRQKNEEEEANVAWRAVVFSVLVVVSGHLGQSYIKYTFYLCMIHSIA